MEVEDAWLRLVRALRAGGRVSLATNLKLDDVERGTVVGQEQKIEQGRASGLRVVHQKPWARAGRAAAKPIKLRAEGGT